MVLKYIKPSAKGTPSKVTVPLTETSLGSELPHPLKKVKLKRNKRKTKVRLINASKISNRPKESHHPGSLIVPEWRE